MLDINAIELYTAHLTPPEGYKTKQALCLTYSLDLTMLLAAVVSLFLRKELCGTAEKERYDVLASLQGIKKKLRLYCQAGQIHVPKEFNRLYHLIEPAVHMIAKEKGCFHPKLWLIHYEPEHPRDGGSRYRLLVLSRNLTDSRDWDITFYADGHLDSSFKGNTNLIHFIKTLPVKQDPFLTALSKNLGHIRFDKPADVSAWDFKGLPARHSLFPASCDGLLIISPFIRATQLKELVKMVRPGGAVYLFSRQEELDRLSTNSLAGCTCYVLKESVIDGETLLDDEISFRKKNNLHGKAYFWEGAGSGCGALLGSANCTHAAFNENIEAMVRLQFEESPFDSLLENLTPRDEAAAGGIFSAYIPQIAEENDEEQEWVRQCKRSLILSVNKVIIIKVDNGYEMRIPLDAEIAHPENYHIFLAPLTRKNDFQELVFPEAVYKNQSIEDVTAFFVIEIRKQQNTLDRFMMRLEIEVTDMAIFKEREQAVIHHLFSSLQKLLTYLAYLLNDTPLSDPGELGRQISSGNSAGGETLHYESIPLYERLLVMCAVNPGQLKKIDHTIGLLKSNTQIDKEQFQQLIDFWQPFRVFIPGDER